MWMKNRGRGAQRPQTRRTGLLPRGAHGHHPGLMSRDSDSHAPISTTWDRHANKIIGATAILMLAIGTLVYRILEDWAWVDSFYFSAVALSTVGFGDLHPTTTASKLFTVFYIFTGVAMIATFLNQLGKRLATRERRRLVRPSIPRDAQHDADPTDNRARQDAVEPP